MTAERNDPEQAEKDARVHSRPVNAAPHYVRCTWYSGMQRCKLADGHAGKHSYPQEAQ